MQALSSLLSPAFAGLHVFNHSVCHDGNFVKACTLCQSVYRLQVARYWRAEAPELVRTGTESWGKAKVPEDMLSKL